MKLLKDNRGQGIISAGMIMSVIITLIILSVGVYAFFTTMDSIPVTGDPVAANATNNTTLLGESIFNIVGIVITIGAILLIVQMVYTFSKPQ